MIRSHIHYWFSVNPASQVYILTCRIINTVATVVMAIWNKSCNTTLQGLGAGITVTALLLQLELHAAWGSFGCLLLHECVLIGYVNPIVRTILYVAVAHVIAYTIVTALHTHFGHLVLLPCVALGLTLLLLGTILSLLCRPSCISTPPIRTLSVSPPPSPPQQPHILLRNTRKKRSSSSAASVSSLYDYM